MNFQKLCSVILESKKKDAPRLGALGKRVADAAGPAGYAGGSSGFGQPVERVPLTRWEWAKSSGGKYSESGAAAEKSAFREIGNAFRLMSMDAGFEKSFQNMLRTMEKRDGYKNIKLKKNEDSTGEEEHVKYDEEGAIKKLPALVQKTGGEAESRREIMDRLKTEVIDVYNSATDEDRDQVLMDISSTTAKIKSLKSIIKKTKDDAKKANYEKTLSELEGELDELTMLKATIFMTPSQLKQATNQYEEFKSEFEKYQAAFEKYTQEYDEVIARTTKIDQHNKDLSDRRVEAFKTLLIASAQTLLIEAEAEMARRKISTELPAEPTIWDKVPKTLEKEVAMLRDLANLDPNVNPILGYLEVLTRDYDAMKAALGDRELDSNVNVTIMRNFQALPFVRLGKMYYDIKRSKEFAARKMKFSSNTESNSNLGDDVSTTAYKELMSIFNSIKTDKDILNKVTSDSAIVNLKDLINKSPIDNNSKEAIEIAIEYASEMNDIRNIKTKLQNSMKAAGHDTSINESFTNFTNRLLNEFTFDQDDYELDILELKSLKKRH
jgi:hypothetical protein